MANRPQLRLLRVHQSNPTPLLSPRAVTRKLKTALVWGRAKKTGTEGADQPAANPDEAVADNSSKSTHHEGDEFDSSKQLLEHFRQQGDDYSGRYDDLVKTGKEFGVAVVTNQKRAIEAAVKEYELKNVERKGSQEERVHFLLIQNWFFGRVAASEGALRWCATLIRKNQRLMDDWGTLSRRVADLVQRPTTGFDVGTALNDLSFASRRLEDELYGATESCNVRDFGTVPEPPPLGNSLGSLQFMAGWLLDASSLQLALIVGMMGFGLLGAVISTFVKERRASPARDAAQPIISDLAGVMLKGLSAAMVVFLAVQGGLAVLSGAGSEPNPYVLLLACFVAAVFSEQVWMSAQQYLYERLPEPNSGKKTGQANAPSSSKQDEAEVAPREQSDEATPVEPPFPEKEVQSPAAVGPTGQSSS